MPLLWCVGISACLFIMSGMEATGTKVEETHSLMSQWNWNMNTTTTYFCANTHADTHKLQRIFPFIFSLRVGFVYTALLHHLRALTERDGLCGERMEVWWIHNFALCVGLLCVWEHFVCSTLYVWGCALATGRLCFKHHHWKSQQLFFLMKTHQAIQEVIYNNT